MILTYQYRLVPSRSQHRALEAILESQRLLYNAALEERMGAYRRGVSITSRMRSNLLHQASARLVRDYDVIAIEALNVQGLARSQLAPSWARFISFLTYKAVKAGARLIEVDPRNTSQECSGCGTTVPKNLSERWHDCPRCGLSIDRDLNAARNILGRAGVGPCLPNVAGCGTRAGGSRAVSEDLRKCLGIRSADTTR